MTVNLFQIVMFVIANIVLFNYLKKSSALFDYTLILSGFLVFNVFLFKPDLLMTISGFFGIARGVDIFLYSSIFLLFFLAIHLQLKIEKNKEDISLLARRISILLSKMNAK